MQRRPFFGLLALPVSAAALLAPRVGAQSRAPHEVTISGMQFMPAELQVQSGETVRWTNQEKRTSHSLLFADQPESERLLPGEHWERRFDQAGDYPYVCGPHPDMKGRILVR
ncbi:plastocyanin [Inhella inkyongensis]|uniref:Plastocyanin n=1 Tax=Inhella inkyongensis TaxID=392593 RepID=A0A840S414_9BURK|nr:plastocyanin/azurin family copper-binding protein [Inhella inkyongensis]MBB5203391.1 plastocyanin [Inhella inkyongensis]